MLHALEGLREDEIARIYGWDEQTVKAYLARARDTLRERLGWMPRPEALAQVEHKLEAKEEKP